ncbi:MAG: hypothetical protein IPK23_15755 [Rhizobiales bacterium]|nr:hypothetical protein [Hyphomicrobiales bacterium]
MQKSKSKKFDLQSRLANIRKFAEKNHTRDKFRDDYLLRLYRVLRHYRGFGEHKKFQKALLALAKEQKISRKYSRAERLLIELTAPQITTYHKSRLALLLGVLLKKIAQAPTLIWC